MPPPAPAAGRDLLYAAHLPDCDEYVHGCVRDHARDHGDDGHGHGCVHDHARDHGDDGHGHGCVRDRCLRKSHQNCSLQWNGIFFWQC